MKFKNRLFILLLFFLVNFSFSQNKSNTNQISEINSFKDSNEVIDYPKFIPPNYIKQQSHFYTLDIVPQPRENGIFGYISDPDDFLSEEKEEEINKVLYSLEKNTSAEVIIVIVNSIGS
ncbi:TPM domain-containing protein [Cellulophaga baltica]|nr:TPM domain-containing protein [Cellulophaga baltica]